MRMRRCAGSKFRVMQLSPQRLATVTPDRNPKLTYLKGYLSVADPSLRRSEPFDLDQIGRGSWMRELVPDQFVEGMG